MDKLVDSFSEHIAEAKGSMPDEEFHQAEKRFDDVVNKVRARSPLS